MKFLLTISFMVVLSFCTNKVNDKIDFSKKKAFPAGSLPSNAFYFINNLDSPGYKIKWGHKFVDTLITDTTYSLLGSGAVGYLASNKSVILLGQECGTDCNYVIVLPFNKYIKPKLFYGCIAIDTSNNLVAYVTEEDSSFFTIENFLTNKRIKIKEDNICKSSIKFSCIDSCYFDNDFFYLKWFGKNYDGAKNPDWVVKEYSTKEVSK